MPIGKLTRIVFPIDVGTELYTESYTELYTESMDIEHISAEP